MKRKISSILIVIMLFNLAISSNFNLGSNVVYGADKELKIVWARKYELTDQQLQPIRTENKYDRETALVDWDMSRDGKYVLKYHLTDDTLTEVVFNKTADEFDVTYRSDKVSEQDVSYIKDAEYIETDFSVTPPGSIKGKVTTEGVIAFNNIKLMSKNPRKSFEVNNINVKFSYYNDVMYYSTNGLEEGNLTPFEIDYFNSIDKNEGNSKILILRSLEDFIAKPSHFDGNPLQEPDIIEIVNDKSNPGTKPGITMSFKHPKVWNDEEKGFIVDDSAELKNSSVKIKLTDNSEGTGYNSLTTNMLINLSKSNGAVGGDIVHSGTIEDKNANKDVQYTYDEDEKKYEIKIVQDNQDLNAINKQFLQWSALQSSRLYVTELTFEPTDIGDIRTTEYIPESTYAYTYLEYNINRESAEDAHIEIKPYAGLKDRTLYYKIYSHHNLGLVDSELWLTYTHTIGETPDQDNLVIPIKFDTGGYYYKIKIEFDKKFENEFQDNGIKSQTSKFTPNQEDVIAPPVPKILEIESNVYQNIGNNIEEPSKIKTKLTWEAPSITVLEDLISKGNLYYEMMINKDAMEINSKYIPIKIFEVYKESGYIKVKEVQDTHNSDKITEGNGYDAESEGYRYGYNQNENKFCVENIILKNDDEWTKELNTTSKLEDIELGNYIYEMTPNDYEGIKELPNVNFIKMRGINVNSDDGKGAVSKNSFIKSLSLSLSKREVPIISNLDYKGLPFEAGNDFAMLDIMWRSAEWTKFDEEIEVENVYYDIYISQNKENLLNVVPSEIIPIQGNKLSEVDLNSNISDIRDSKVIKFTKIGDKSLSNQKVIVKGLDQNQIYYTYVVTRFEDKHNNNFISKKSSVLSMTTNNKSNKPIEKDKSPLVPENFKVLEMLSDTSIKLIWDKNSEPIEQNETIGYELVKVANDTLSDDEHNNKKLEDIIKERTDDVQGFRVIFDESKSSYKVYKYEKDKDQVEIVDHLEENKRDKTLILNDDKLSPNVIYYYYLRAIRVENSQIKYDVLPSLWTALTYTTKPIARPINLKVDYTQKYHHDSQHELIVHFEVPEYFVNSNFKPIIYMHSEDDNGFSDDKDYENYKQVGVEEEGAQKGYKILYYKISGYIEEPDLKSGKSFSIKVCMEDRSKGLLPNNKYPRSGFSNRVIGRTEYDEGEYDRENKINNYMKYYENEAEKLLKNLYWTIDEDKKSLEVVYRSQNLQNELKSIPGNEFKLVTNDKKRLTYYISKDVLDTIVENNIKLIVSNDEMNITINSDTLNKSKTAEFRKFIEQVKYQKEVINYYVVLSVDFIEADTKIKGTEPLGDMVRIKLDAQGSEMADFHLEALAIQKIEQLTERERPELETEIVRELNKDKIDEDDIIKLVDAKIHSIAKSQTRYIESLISENTHKVTKSTIYNLYEPIEISNIIEGTIGVQGYKKDGKIWEYQDTQMYGNLSTMYVDTTGEFVFAGKKLETNPLESIGNGYHITGIFEKYRLLDFYSTTELKYLKQDTSKSDLIASSARIIGAPKGSDSVNFLVNNGIEVNRNNIYDSIKKDEAIYILVKVYGIKQDIDLDSIMISNYNEIKDMNSVNGKYKKEVLAGRALELIELDDGYFNPHNNMSIKEVLTIIGLMENRPW